MRNRRLALAAALLLAITSADGAALAVSGADFSSEEVAEAVFDEVENEGLDNQDEVQEQVQTPEMDQVEDQSSEDSFSDASGMEAAAEWQNGRMRKRQQQTKPWFFQMEKTQELPTPCQMMGNW